MLKSERAKYLGLCPKYENIKRIILDLAETKELFAERLVRELARTVQKLRKQKGLEVWDGIVLRIGTDKKTEKIIRNWEKKLKPMVGAREVKYRLKKAEAVCSYKDRKISVWR
jgi:hypothetical protein